MFDTRDTETEVAKRIETTAEDGCVLIERLETDNSEILIEHGPAGVIAGVRHSDGEYWAGPLPDETLAALREVAGE